MAEPRVVLYPADVTACGGYRMLLPVAALEAEGFTLGCYPPGHPKRLQAEVTVDRFGVQHCRRVVDPEADVVVFQRPLSRLFYEAMVHMKSNGVKIVIELDDDFKALSPRHGAYRLVHPRYSPHSNWEWLDKALGVADLLVAATPNLARRYGRRTESVVVPNRVPSSFLDIARPPATTAPKLGWAGTMESHPADVQVMRGGVAEALRAAGLDTLHVVGPGTGVSESLGVPVTATGWVPYADYADHVVHLDVGLAPLEQSTFNDSKSWLKPLEYAALGIPGVGSPSAEYRRLRDEHGIGFIAEKPSQWRGLLRMLLNDHDARAAESARLRTAVVEEGLTIEATAKEWWNAWTSVL